MCGSTNALLKTHPNTCNNNTADPIIIATVFISLFAKPMLLFVEKEGIMTPRPLE